MPTPFTHGQRRPNLLTMNDPLPPQSLLAPLVKGATPPNLLKPAPVDPAYANVLKFPETPEYVKYFEDNPHPEKVADKEYAIWMAFRKNDLAFKLDAKQRAFERMIQERQHLFSDMDRKISRMPEYMNKRIHSAGSKDEKTLAQHLRNSFLNYLSTSLDPSIVPDNLWIDFGFAAATAQAQSTLQDLTANRYNDLAMEKLVEKLHKSGTFERESTDFFFWNTDPRYWNEVTVQSRPVIYYAPDKPGTWLGAPSIYFLLQYQALGNHTFEAIPEGSVKSLGNNKYQICVKKWYYIVHDTFNFEGHEFLGLWPLSTDEELNAGGQILTPFFNGSFRGFQRHGYGRYFNVFSLLHELEGDHGKCWEYTHGKQD